MHIHVNFYHEISIAKQGLYDGLMQYLVFDKKHRLYVLLQWGMHFLICIYSQIIKLYSKFLFVIVLVHIYKKPVRCVFQAYFHAYKSFNLKFSDLFFDKKKKDFLDLQLNISEEFDNL